MCRLIALAFVLVITLIAVIVVWCTRHLPWWGTVLVVVGLIAILPALLKFAGRWMFTSVLMGLFGAKGKVLRGATATLHSVQATASPVRRREPIDGVAADGQEVLQTAPAVVCLDGKRKGDEDHDEDTDEDFDEDFDEDEGSSEDEEDQTPRNHYYLDVTITPKPAAGKFTHWDIDDLMLVPYDTKVTPTSDVDDDACLVREVRLMRQGAAAEPDGSKFVGPQRLRLLIAVKPEIKRLKFRYYFESFGDVRLT